MASSLYMEKRGFLQRLISTFSSSATLDAPPITKVKLNGANYDAIDTGDGYHVVKDVPILSEIDKGTHGAPYKVDKGELLKFHANMESRYKMNRAGALSIGHNDDLGVTHPAFAGFFVPSKVAEYEFPHHGKKWTLFCDFKIPNDKFTLFAAGKLPWHSPEIYAAGWEHRKIEIVSFLDTKPPYFDWQNSTVGSVVKDDNARFDAVYDGPGSRFEDFEKQLIDSDLGKLFDKDKLAKLVSKFAAYEEKSEKKEEKSEGDKPPTEVEGGDDKKGEKFENGGEEGEVDVEGEKDVAFEKQFPDASRKLELMSTTITKMAQHLGMDGRDSMPKKPDNKPVEPGDDLGGSKMGLSAEEAAKFAALANDNAEIKAKLAAQELKEKVSAFMAKADAILSKKHIAPEVRDSVIAKFAADAVAMKDGGEKWFTDTIEKLKTSLRDKPPSTPAEFAAASGPSIEPTDPVLSKFAANGSNMEEVAKFAAQYRQTKAIMGDRLSCDEESYIKNEILQAKFQRENPEGVRGNRR